MKKNHESDDRAMMYEIKVEGEVIHVTRETFYGMLLKRLEETKQTGIECFDQGRLEELLLFICEREYFGKPIILQESKNEDDAADPGHKFRSIVFDFSEIERSEGQDDDY